tara:strand:+ start:526 stop:738 length:213 start_codon:yes stop_codon:yes gene_type:complete
MAEAYSTDIDWTGSVEVGKRLSDSIPEGLASELKIEGENATLSVSIKSETLEQLRSVVDKVLALFGQEED